MRKQVYTRRRSRLRSLLLFTVAASLLTALLVRTDRVIRPNLCAVCESETRRYAANLMADSIAAVLAEQSYCYQDFATLVYDTSGNVTAVETITGNVNALQAEMLTTVQNHLEECRDASLEVSLGTATGVWLFAGRGPHVSVRLMPIGNASVKLISALESAGVNQTCHSIRAEVTAEIRAAIPFSETITTATYECLISETVIVGTVPESYLEFGGKGKAEGVSEGIK